MSVDWYSSLMALKKDKIEKKVEEFHWAVQQRQERRSNEANWMRKNLTPIFAENTLREKWFNFFEKLSLFEAYFEATGGPKQDVREVYFGQVCPAAEQSYEVPDEGLDLSDALRLEIDPSSLKSNLSHLPLYSWLFHFRFTLASPYLSKDDAPFYVIDNPVRKDRVFKLPMVSPTSWKGGLRAALRRISMGQDEPEGWSVEKERQNPSMTRLFGNVKGEEEQDELHAGRLRFFPTFFDRIGREVINPHDREGGAGDQPIYFECVPEKAKGAFSLLYVPFDTVGKPDGWTDPISQQSPRQIALADMIKVTDATARLLTLYGFGAKTSSGFGVANSMFSRLNDGGERIKGGTVCFRDSDQTRCWTVGSFGELVRQALEFYKEARGGGQ